jgi:hypothetical protein
MTTRTRRAGLVLALVCLLGTPSCVTAALWDEPCGRPSSTWSQGEVVGRVLLTPFTLMIDAVLISAYACGHGCGHGCR